MRRRFRLPAQTPSLFQPVQKRSSHWFALLLLTGTSICTGPAAGAAEPAAGSARAASRPNILWITAEDMSPVLGCYGDTQAVTPNLDQLARKSVRFTHAFATAPVCSPVRSTLITGCFAPSLGTHNMRSGMPLSADVRGFPALLREAGYYTCNNVKTDYNTWDEPRLLRESWDENSATAHWRNRPASDSQPIPFFAVFNLMTSHQSRSMVWPYEKFQEEVQSQLPASMIHSPKEMELPPWYPDTPIVRRDWARFYDCVTAMDQQVGRLLRQLDEDHLADNTIVFFFSDHGSGMPRYKRTLLDSGMHVPLLVRTPSRWQHLLPGTAGATDGRLVSFPDLPSTVLELAGVTPPGRMPGRALTASSTSQSHPSEKDGRRYVFGHRDRVDEAFDCARSIRSKSHLLILNFMPHLGYHQPTAWPDQGQIRAEISEAARKPGASRALQHYTASQRPPVEFFDCVSDPLNLNNRAADPSVSRLKRQMKQDLYHHLLQSNDHGFIPEPLLARLMITESNDLPAGTADGRRPLTAVDPDLLRHSLQAAFRSLTGDVPVLPVLATAASPEQIVSDYWSAVALRSRELNTQQLETLYQRVHALRSEDRSGKSEDLMFSSAAIQVAALLASQSHRPRLRNIGLELLTDALTLDDLNTVLAATRELQLLQPAASNVRGAMAKLSRMTERLLPAATTATFVQSPEQDLAMFINFSASAYLDAVH